MIACLKNDAQHVDILLHGGAKIDVFTDSRQFTALYVAVQFGYAPVEVVKLLINRATPEQKQFLLNHPDQSKNTPLHQAARKGFAEVVEVCQLLAIMVVGPISLCYRNVPACSCIRLSGNN